MGLWLVILWCVLWHDYGLGTILSGIVIAALVSWRYKLPPVLLSGRINIIYVVAFAVRLVYKLIVASLKVAWLAAAPPLAGPWASLEFPGARPSHWAPMHIDTLPGDSRTLH